MDNNKQIEKSYDYIVSVTKKQGRLLDKETLYGDGSIHGFNKMLFDSVYDTIAEIYKTFNN